jgi:excisionase family DNA binding protein
VTTSELDQLPPVLTSAEAASALRIGLREIRGLIDSGQLPAARLGPRRIVRVRRDAVLSLLAGTPAPRPARRRPRTELVFPPQAGGTPQREE